MQPLRLDTTNGSATLSSLEEGQTLLSPGSEAHVKKRNRISFVCQACRRSKTKCDREKPRCSRCAQHGIQCVYDVEKQPAPKNPSKDATIARLEKEVTYWKKKAQEGLAKEEEDPNVSKRYRDSTYPSSGAEQAKKIKKWSSYNITSDMDNILVNLYRTHPSMIMNKVMKREVKPLSENYAITQDIFLSGLISAVFLTPSNNTMIPALSASATVSRALPSVRDNVTKLKEKLRSQCHNEAQKQRINEFTERILQNSTNGRVQGMLPNTIRSAFDRNFMEDMTPSNGDYSEVLKSFIVQIQEILPPLKIVKSYKAHFFDSVFPNLPFLNKHLFEESLASTLFEDENDPTKIKIKLGRSRLRNKMEHLCILLVILKLSFISLLFIDEGSENVNPQINRDVINKYPIKNEVILLAENVLSAENLFACANENIITCLLYIWAFFVYSPEEGDFFFEHPTDVLTGVIVMLATSIGLHRDPSDFPRMSLLEDASVMNHRRKLWVAIITTICIESSLKGRHPLSLDAAMDQFMTIRSPHALEDYLQKIKRNMTKQDVSEEKIQELCLKRALMARLIYDIDKLSLTYTGSFRLGEMEELRNKLETFVTENFEHTNADRQVGENKEATGTDPNISSDVNDIQYSVGLQAKLMSRLVLLRASMALFFHFETAAIQDPEQLPVYQKYLIRVCTDALTLIKLITKYFGDGYAAGSFTSSCYNITKGTQLALSSTFFGMLGIIMRVEMAGNVVFSKFQEEVANNDHDNLPTTNQKVEVLNALRTDLESALESVHYVASKHLRFTYYSVFKMLALFDVIIQRMKNGELWSTMLRLQKIKEMNQRSVKALSMTLSLDLDGRYTVIDQLEKRNHLLNFSVEQLSAISREVRFALQGNETSSSAQDQTASYPAFTDKGFTGYNFNLGNMDKLSSAAALSQNVDMQSNPMGNYEMNNINNARTSTNNDSQSVNNHKNDLDLASGLPMDFPGLFGGLDLFDYDFLFSNDG